MADHFPDATKKVDFIRRDEVHVQIERALCDGLPYHRTIDEIPAADVRPVVHGRWEIASDPRFRHCSVCHDKVVFNMKNYPNFCDVYGADMRPDKNGQRGEKNDG